MLCIDAGDVPEDRDRLPGPAKTLQRCSGVEQNCCTRNRAAECMRVQKRQHFINCTDSLLLLQRTANLPEKLTEDREFRPPVFPAAGFFQPLIQIGFGLRLPAGIVQLVKPFDDGGNIQRMFNGRSVRRSGIQ